MLRQLPFQLVAAVIDARISLALMAGYEHILVLRTHDHFHARRVFTVSFGAAVGVKDDLDFLDPVVIFGQLVRLLLGVSFHRRRNIHMPRGNYNYHVDSFR